MAQLRITVLVDSNSAEQSEKEHGFSVWIETGNRCILFDTGNEKSLLTNAEKLRINLKRAGSLVLSHGHRNHTGAVSKFLSLNNNANVYYVTGVDVTRYSYQPEPKSDGMPDDSRKALQTIAHNRQHPISRYMYISPGIGVTGPVPRKVSFENTGGDFYFDKEHGEVDTIHDDQALWFEADEGLVIIVGCCHAGLVNTVNYIRQVSGKDTVRGIIGGMHLFNASEDRLNQTFEFLKELNASFIVPCHCTGKDVAQKMQDAVGPAVKFGQVGMNILAGNLTSSF